MVSENILKGVSNITKTALSRNLKDAKKIYKIELGNWPGIINFSSVCSYLASVAYFSVKFTQELYLLIFLLFSFLGFLILVPISLRAVINTEMQIPVMARIITFSKKYFEDKNGEEKRNDEGNIYERAATIAGFVAAIILCLTMIIYGFNSKLPYFFTLSIGIVIFLLVIFWYRNK